MRNRALRLTRPMLLGFEHEEQPEKDAGPFAGLRKFLPSLEQAIRTLRKERDREERAFRPTGASLLHREAESLAKLAALIERGRPS